VGSSHSTSSSNSLRLLQRNFSYDSSAGTTPSTPSSLGPKTFRASPHCSESSTNDSHSTLFGSPSSRSNSPPDQSNDLNLFESSNILDMLNYLTINQQQQQQQANNNSAYQVREKTPSTGGINFLTVHLSLLQNSSSFHSPSTTDIELLQNIQTLNTLRLFQQNQMIQQNHMMQQFANHLSNGSFFPNNHNHHSANYEMPSAGKKILICLCRQN
jgi:hypothetical protein